MHSLRDLHMDVRDAWNCGCVRKGEIVHSQLEVVEDQDAQCHGRATGYPVTLCC